MERLSGQRRAHLEGFTYSVEGASSPAALNTEQPSPASLGLHVLIIKSEGEVSLLMSYMKSCCPKEDK